MSFQFIKSHWVGLAGLFVGLLGLALSAYFYSLTIKERTPVFEVSSERALVANTKNSDNSKIKVVRSDGELIDGEIWTVRFYFWNTGKVSIRRTEILAPLTLTFSESGVEILDFAILNQSRPQITQGKLTEDQEGNFSSINLDFNILEEKDVIEGQITYVGSEEVGLSILGSIEGVRNIPSEAPVNWVSVWANFFKYSMYTGIAILVFVVIDFIEKAVKSLALRLFPVQIDKIKPAMVKIDKMGPKILGSIVVLGGIFFFAYISATPKASKELRNLTNGVEETHNKSSKRDAVNGAPS